MAEIEFNEENRLDVDLTARAVPLREEQGLIFLVKKMHLAKNNEQAEKILIVIAIACFVMAFGVVLLLVVRPKNQATYKVSPEILKDIQNKP
ncbi:MAG: hypothetical protein V4519_04710 [Patescibacteria group bacterium]